MQIKHLLTFALLVYASHSLGASVVPIGLLEVYQSVADNNSQLAAAREDFYAKQEAVPQALAFLLPAITSSASIDKKKLDRSSPSLERTRSTTTYQATLRQPLFHAEFWYGLKSAEIAASQAALDFSNKEQLLMLKTIESYFEVLRASDILAASNSEVRAFKNQLSQANAKLKGGVFSITDVYDAQTALDNSIEAQIQAETKLEDTYEVLRQLSGRPFGKLAGLSHSLPIVAPIPDDSAEWVERARSHNIELQSAQLAISIAEKNLSSRRSEHLPSVDAVAGYRLGDNDSFGYSNPSDFGRSDYRGHVAETTISVELNIPLYSGGRTSSKVREGVRRLSESVYLKDEKQRQVALNARNYYRAVMADLDLVSSKSQTVKSSQQSLKASVISSKVGTRNFLDVLNAERQLYGSVKSYNNARYDYVLDVVRLKQAVGELSLTDINEITAYLNPNYVPDRDFLPPGVAEHIGDLGVQ